MNKLNKYMTPTNPGLLHNFPPILEHFLTRIISYTLQALMQVNLWKQTATCLDPLIESTLSYNSLKSQYSGF